MPDHSFQTIYFDDEVSRRLRLIIHDAAEEGWSSDVDCRADLKFLAGHFVTRSPYLRHRHHLFSRLHHAINEII